MVSKVDVARYLENWQDEIESAFLYQALARAEPQPALAEVYRRLAATEESHAQFWEDKLLAVGQLVPKRKIGWRTRFLALLTKWFGSQFVLPTVNAMEQVDSHSYDAQIDTQNTQLPIQERSHARLLQTISSLSRTGLEGGTHSTARGSPLRLVATP